MEYLITNHAATRYAERIADKETVLDATAYVVKNKEKIENDINTMIEHSRHLYYGKVGTRDNTNVDVYLSGTWVILVDPRTSKVITLFKIDFGVGEDFNKQFVQKVLDKIEEHQKILEEKKKQVEEEKVAYINIVKDNEAQIAEYRAIIKRLENANRDYQEVIDNIDSQCAAAALAIKRDVENLVMKKEF